VTGGKSSGSELPTGPTGSLPSASTVKSPLPLGDPLTSHRPPVFIAAAAATVLGALYFVPNASASAEHVTTKAATTVQTSATTADSQQQLADTGSVNTTPYLVGGTAFLGMGAALLVNATRRSREAEAGPPA
jgi:hypothetical protein